MAGLAQSPSPPSERRELYPEASQGRNATLAKIGGGRPNLMVSVAAGSMKRSMRTGMGSRFVLRFCAKSTFLL